MKKLIILIILFLSLLINTSCTNNKNYKRLRIIANSNSEIDINEKIQIKNTIIELINKEIISYETLNEETLKKELKNKLNNSLYEKIEIKECISYYPAKTYNNKFIKSGNYETLLITIKEGKGNNFWTLLYPEYFGFEAEETNEIEYRSYFYDKLS